MIKQKLNKEKLRHNFSVRLNKNERSALERTASKYKFNSLADFIRSLAVYENDILTNEKLKTLSDVSRATSLLKAIYLQAQENKDHLEQLEIVSCQLAELKEILKKKDNKNKEAKNGN